MRKKSQIKERILQFIDLQEIPTEEFCRKIGMASSNLRGAQLYSDPNARVIAKIVAIYPQLSPDWLLNGIGDMERKSKNYSNDNSYDKNKAPELSESLHAGEEYADYTNSPHHTNQMEQLILSQKEEIAALHAKISKIQEEWINKQQELLNHFSNLLVNK